MWHLLKESREAFDLQVQQPVLVSKKTYYYKKK